MVCAARLSGSRVQDFHPAGSLSPRSGTVLETLPFCLASGWQSSCVASGPPASLPARPAPPLQVPEVPRWRVPSLGSHGDRLSASAAALTGELSGSQVARARRNPDRPLGCAVGRDSFHMLAKVPVGVYAKPN